MANIRQYIDTISQNVLSLPEKSRSWLFRQYIDTISHNILSMPKKQNLH